MYELYMSIPSLFLTQQGRRAADFEQVLGLKSWKGGKYRD
jgi:hypothetical protein